MTDRRLARAAKRLRTGRMVPGCINVLLEDGTVLEVPLDDLPARTAETESGRLIELARRYFVLREWLRENAVAARAAVVVTEAWAVKEPVDVRETAVPSRYPSIDPARGKLRPHSAGLPGFLTGTRSSSPAIMTMPSSGGQPRLRRSSGSESTTSGIPA
jgi:hypothetical protein